jgi:hypothetical protein
MTESQLMQIFNAANGVNLLNAVKVVFAAGYCAHAGTPIAGTPYKIAAFPSSIPDHLAE